MNTPTETIITEPQTSLVNVAQELYGDRAKSQLELLAEALELTEEQQARLIGSFTLRKEGLDFEQLRIISASAETIREVIGGLALGAGREFPVTNLSTVTSSEPTPAPVRRRKPSGASNTSPLSLADSGENVPADTQTEAPNVAADELEKAPAPYPLGERQRTWMGKIYDKEYVERIEQLPPEKQLQLVQAIAKRYRGLSVRRLTSENKKLRSKQLIDFFEGKSLEDIGKDTDVSASNVSSALSTMAKTISSNISPSTRKRMLPRSGSKEAPKGDILDTSDNTKGAEADKSSVEVDLSDLTDMQRAWFTKVFEGKALVKDVAGDTKKAEVLVAQLEEYIYLHFINRGGEDTVKRRCEQIMYVLLGFDEQNIATVTLTTLEQTKTEIEETANTLRDEIDDAIRSDLLDKALE